jgi:hypothetical protein
MRQIVLSALAGLTLVATARADAPQPVAAAKPEAKPAAAPAEAPHRAPMPFEAARERTFAWAAATAGENGRPPEAVRRLWATAEPGLPARGLHDLVVKSFAAVDPATAEFLGTIDLRNPSPVPPDAEPLLGRSADEFYRTNVSLYVARAFADRRFYDESLALVEKADLAQAVDPASALFYKAVCEHQLMKKKEGLETLTALEERTEAVPESYAAVARLMRAELEALDDDSLDKIAGLMRDVERRLELARGGKKVQQKEDEIADKLDEVIKKIEEQMRKSQGGGSGVGNANRSSNPANDSTVKGATAPGEVDPKSVRREGGWGDLPPREREQAKNEIEKAFPANYGRLINEYFLKRSRGERPAGE